MTRREILRYTALATGAAVSVPLATALLSGCQSELQDNYVPQFFEEETFSVIKHMMNTILPKTDSPSAIGVGAHQVMDEMVLNVYTEEEQLEFQTQFKALQTYLSEAADAKAFDTLRPKQQLALLQTLEQSEAEELADVRATLLDVKQQTIAYYLSSEEIATNYLNYLPVPGEYQPCISLEEAGGKAWAI